MEKKSKTLFKLGKSKNLNKETKKDLNENDLSQNNVPNESEKHGKKILKDLNKQQEKQKKIEQQQLKLQQQQINSIIKSKQKQIKMQQKKSNEDNKFYTFKSKNKNDTDLNNQLATTSSSTKSVQDKTKFISFNQEPDKMEVFSYRVKGKLVGIEPVMAAKGDKMCQNALKNLKLIRRSTSSHKQRIIININLDGVQLLDQKTNELVANHVINLISYITRDATDSHTFGYVYGTPEVGHQFIAIKSEKDSKYIMKAIGELFTYVYNKKKREKFLELESRNFNCNLNENTQNFVDNRIEDKKDNLDYESLMNFLKQQQEKNFQQPSSSSQILPSNNFDSLNKSFNSSIDCKIDNNKLTQSSFDSLPPLPPPRNESGQSNYSSNSNLNSFGTYDTMNSNSNLDSLQSKNNCNTFQSTNSLATDASHSEMQTLQNVISSARKANEKYKNWQIFEDNSNNLRSDSVNSNQDSDSIVDDCGWASFSPPSHPPPPLYTSNEDLSLTLTSADTFTLTNANVAEDNNKFISKELNTSQNSTDILQINTPPLSTRRRRRSLKSIESNIIKIDDSIKNKLIQDNLEKTKRKQSQCSSLGFENDFNDVKQFKKNEEKSSFFDQNYSKANDLSFSKDNIFKSDSKTSTLTKNSIACFESFNFDSFDSKKNDDFNSNQSSLNKGFGFINNIEAFNLNSNLNNLNSLENIYDDSKPNYSSFDSAISVNQSSKKDKNYDVFDNEKKSLNLDNSYNKTTYDPNDKYAVFNNMNNLKLSIFSDKKEEDFFNENQEKNYQSFEDSFLNNTNTKKLSFNSNKSDSNEKNIMNLEKNTFDFDKNTLNFEKKDDFNDNEDLINVHKKFLQERQEKLDQIDKIFEEEKEKLRLHQKEITQNHLKEQKDLLAKQKKIQQEFYQRQKYQRQSILHQLQLQRLSVTQFDQCKLQLQQKLKNDQKQLQNEFIKNQQLLKKNQKDEQQSLISQYKLLEQQYLEKQSELLNSNFEIEVDLPELPNIFENDNFEDQNDKFETSLRNEFDKLTNDLIQTTTSSLNSSPKLIERCSTSCSITSSTSNNPFVFEDLKKNELDLFKDFENSLKIDCEKAKNSNENKIDLDSLIFEKNIFKNFDFNKSSNSAFSDYSFDYFKNDFNKNTSQERISSACSNKTNESTTNLSKNLLNFSSNQDNLLFDRQNENKSSNDLMNKNFFKESNNLLSNSLPKNFDEKTSYLNNSSNSLKNQIPTQNNLFSNKTNDPFNCSFVDSKLNEISRINELRQHTQKQLVSITLPKKEETDFLNLSTNSDKKNIDNIHINEFTEDFENLKPNLDNEDKKFSTANLSFFDNLFDLKKNNSFSNSLNININDNEKKNSSSYQDLSTNQNLSKNSAFVNLTEKNLFTNNSDNFLNRNESKNKDIAFNHFGKEHYSPPERNIFNKTDDPFKDDFFE